MTTTALTPANLCARFATILRDDIGQAAFRQVVARNRTAPLGVCASHDFCDANMVMLAAFQAFGIDADAVTDCFGPDGERNGHADTWSEAWDLFVAGCADHGYPDLSK